MRKIIFIIIVLFFISGCKKYPDDDRHIHLRSVKWRLCYGGWYLTTPAYNFKSNISYSQYFSPDNYIAFNHNGNFTGVLYPTSFSDGTWEFSDNKKSVTIKENMSTNTHKYKILKLDWDELWLENDSVRYTYKKH